MRQKVLYSKVVLVFFVFLLFVCTANLVSADDTKTLSDVATEITNDNVKDPGDESNPKFIKDDYKTDASIIPGFNDRDESSVINSTDSNPSRYVEYKNALFYNNEWINVKLDVTVKSGWAIITFMTNDTKFGYQKQLLVGSNDGSEIDVTVSFSDSEGNPVKYSGLYGLGDLDYGDYKFDTTTHKMYYVDAPNNEPGNDGTRFKDFIIVKDDGLYSSDRTYSKGYYEGFVYVYLNEESSFTTKLVTYGDYLVFPYLYSLNYQIKYDPNNETIEGEAKNTMDNQPVIRGSNTLNPCLYEADGYKFKGWTTLPGKQEEIDYIDKDNLLLNDSDFGDELIVKTLYAQWEPIEYKIQYDPNKGYVDGNPVEHAVDGEMDNPQVVIMGDNDLQKNKYESKGYEFTGWNTKEDGSGTQYTNKYEVTAAKIKDKDPEKPIDTLYAQWKPKEYKIIYDPNDTDLKASVKNPDAMEDDKFDVVNNPDPDKWNSDDHPWPYEIDGYTFVGYKIENTGDTINNPQDFKEYLLNEEDQEVKLYAQWEPWKYYIHYDGNGADNMNAMPSDTFEYFDEKMMSRKNAFGRDGYRFDGFRVEVNGGVSIIWSPEEFKEILKELGPGSSVTLKAQWEKKPVRFQAPVTGVK